MSSNKSSRGGRVPLSSKSAVSSDFTHDELDFNLLRLDPELKAELDEKGFVARWINAKKYLSGGNYHQSGWRAYRKQVSNEDRGALDFNYGVSPEGYIIRNDLILAVKPAEHQEKWKAHLRRKADIQSGVNNSRASELREAAAERGVKAKIYEGYEENGD